MISQVATKVGADVGILVGVGVIVGVSEGIKVTVTEAVAVSVGPPGVMVKVTGWVGVIVEVAVNQVPVGVMDGVRVIVGKARVITAPFRGAPEKFKAWKFPPVPIKGIIFGREGW